MQNSAVKNNYFKSLSEDDVYFLIIELLERGTLDSLIELIELIVYKTEEEINEDVLKSAFLEFITDNDYLRTVPFTHIQDPNTLSLFIARYVGMMLFSTADRGINYDEDRRLTYISLLDYIKNYKETNDQPLNRETIKELINLCKRYNIIEKVSYNQFDNPLTIFTVDFENKTTNSMYHPVSNLILLNTIPTEKQKRVGNAEYIFMHEIGHALQYKVTGNSFEVPESFKATVIKYMFTEAPDEALSEIFADCFSIALMKGTKFEEKNQWIETFGEVRVDMINEYFDRFIKIV